VALVLRERCDNLVYVGINTYLLLKDKSSTDIIDFEATISEVFKAIIAFPFRNENIEDENREIDFIRLLDEFNRSLLHINDEDYNKFKEEIDIIQKCARWRFAPGALENPYTLGSPYIRRKAFEHLYRKKNLTEIQSDILDVQEKMNNNAISSRLKIVGINTKNKNSNEKIKKIALEIQTKSPSSTPSKIDSKIQKTEQLKNKNPSKPYYSPIKNTKKTKDSFQTKHKKKNSIPYSPPIKNTKAKDSSIIQPRTRLLDEVIPINPTNLNKTIHGVRPNLFGGLDVSWYPEVSFFLDNNEDLKKQSKKSRFENYGLDADHLITYLIEKKFNVADLSGYENISHKQLLRLLESPYIKHLFLPIPGLEIFNMPRLPDNSKHLQTVIGSVFMTPECMPSLNYLDLKKSLCSKLPSASNLTLLSLEDCPNLEEIPTYEKLKKFMCIKVPIKKLPIFKKLEELVLVSLDSLQDIPFLNNVNSMELIDLPLKEIPKNWPNLLSLAICNLRNLTSLPEGNWKCLKNLKLIGLENLKNIDHISSVKELEILKCPKIIKNLPENLNNLKILTIDADKEIITKYLQDRMEKKEVCDRGTIYTIRP
jgi:hypothetical protein